MKISFSKISDYHLTIKNKLIIFYLFKVGLMKKLLNFKITKRFKKVFLASVLGTLFLTTINSANAEVKERMTVKQTAGHQVLGDFAPKFASLNDDVLFGQVWSRDGKLSLKLRSIVTISSLIGKGITDSSLEYHLKEAKKKRS